LNIRLNQKIFFLLSFVLSSGFAIASSIVGLNSKDRELTKIPYFYLNDDEVISQNGESIVSNDNNSLSLVNLSTASKEPLGLMSNYYAIQEVLLLKDLQIEEMEHKKFGQIKIQTTNMKFIKFQDFQLPDQLRTLKLFFQSKDSQNLLKNFKTIDLRHKNKLAIGYY
jgi:hypothetical protein